MQTTVPLPELPPGAERLMPDVAPEEIEAERRRLAQAAVAAVFAAEGLLVALALKLRIAAVTRGAGAGGSAAAGGLPGRRVRAGSAAYASGGGRGGAAAGSPLLAGVIDQRLLDAGAKVMQLDARGSAAMARLSAAGLAWMPTFTNITVTITFALALLLNFQIAGTPLSTPQALSQYHCSTASCASWPLSPVTRVRLQLYRPFQRRKADYSQSCLSCMQT